jgi:hypothetical protein
MVMFARDRLAGNSTVAVYALAEFGWVTALNMNSFRPEFGG